MTHDSIGIDISKEHLDVFRLNDGASSRFDNTKAGHKALIAWIGTTNQRIVYEPTGAYHRALEQALAKVGLALVKVNPLAAPAVLPKPPESLPRLTAWTLPY